MTISWEEIGQLVAERTPEGPRLDFKREPYSRASEKKKEASAELRRDATSFVNAGNGRIIIGIEEQSEFASAIRLVEDPVACEKQINRVLASNIEPPFSSGNCHVYAIVDPLDGRRGVVVIDLTGDSHSAPRAVAEDGAIDFWIRAGKSKRRMTYFEIWSSFRQMFGTEYDQETKGIARHEVTKLRWRIERELKRQGSDRWDDLWPSVRDLLNYAKEYGFEVRREVIWAVGEMLDYPRRGIPTQVAVFCIEVISEAIGDACLVWSPKPGVADPNTVALSEHALNITWGLLWDSTRYLRDARIVHDTLQLWSRILRWSRAMALNDIEERVVRDLDRVRMIATECQYVTGVRLIEWSLESAAQIDARETDIPADIFSEVFP